MREKKRESGRGSEYSNITTPERMSGARSRLKEVESETARLLSEEKTAVDEIGLIPIQEPRKVSGSLKRGRSLSTSSCGTSSNLQPAPKKLQKIKREEEADTSMFDAEAVDGLLKSEVFNDTQVNHSANPDEMPKTDDDDSAAEKSDSIPPPKFKKRKAISQLRRPTSTFNDSDSESHANEIDTFFSGIRGVEPIKQYSKFVEKLMAKHPEMKEVVNEVKKRPTAIEIAKQDLQRQREQTK